MPCVEGSGPRYVSTESATPSWLSSGKTAIAERPPRPPPVVLVVGDVTKISPLGAWRSCRTLSTVP